MKKVILLDSGALMFRSIFGWERIFLNNKKSNSDMFLVPPHYTYLLMMLSALKKIGVNKDDIVIVALEGKAWRKLINAEYKGQRKDARESHKEINWDKQFHAFNRLNEQLGNSTNWHFIRENNSEADDIMAVSCRYFKDYMKVIVSSDGDLKQLCYYPNTYFFSIAKKCKGSNGVYEYIPEPLKIIADKAEKGDVSDNIIVRPDDTPEDKELRLQLVNLLKLPAFVENAVIEELKKIQPKEEHLDELPFKNTKEKYLKIYETDKIITPEYCLKLEQKRKDKKKEKAKAKRLANKLTKQV